MKTPSRTLKVWIAAHVGSDGKVRPCPDNHASLRPMKAFVCRCGGKHPLVLTGNVTPTKLNRAEVIELQKAFEAIWNRGPRWKPDQVLHGGSTR